MKKILLFQLAFVLLAIGTGFALEPDVEGAKDHPLLPRMPNYYISGYVDKGFDFHEFYIDDKVERIEGHKTQIDYQLQEGLKSISMLEITRNYTAALKKISGQILSEGDRNATMKIVKDGKEIWISVEAYNEGDSYQLIVVEKKAMEEKITVNLDALKDGIRQTGHIAVYDIYFDTAKSDVKPESESAIKAIADLLKADAALKLYIVGHTDGSGDLSANMQLSEDRAKSVVTALVGKHGIDASRLIAKGAGPLCPVASNDAEDGKAKNRRVELVKI